MIWFGLIVILAAGCSTRLPSTQTATTPSLPPSLTAPAPTNIPRELFRDPHPILGDARVRQTIAFCTDRAALVKSVYPWLTDTAPFLADSFVPPAHWAYAGHDPGFFHYPFDPEQGRALLNEAGWTASDNSAYRVNATGDELTLTLTTTDSIFRQAWAAVWEGQMAECGIRIVRSHTEASWFFGADTGLNRRDFEIAAFAWVARQDLGGLVYPLYSCEQIPSPANNWQGQNFSGWCNETAEAALMTATTSLRRDEQRAAYAALQSEFTRDLPSLPLFYRVDVFAVNPDLENFAATDDGIHTWNSEQWRIANKDTIVIGEDGEPASLSPFENAYMSDVIRTLINGRDVSQQQNEYVPLLLKQIPSLENGGVTVNDVTVKEGDTASDWMGNIVTLSPGVVILDTDGNKINYNGGEIPMARLKSHMIFWTALHGRTGNPFQPMTTNWPTAPCATPPFGARVHSLKLFLTHSPPVARSPALSF
jgi:hypothetical protein